VERRKLTGLRPQAYEHPLDASTLNALQNTRGLETLVRKCNQWGFERLLRVQLTGSYLRVTPDSFAEVHDQVRAACEILDLPAAPEVYIANAGGINAFTAGVHQPLVVLSSDAIDRLSEEELFFVIAHELGHIKSGHVLYYQIAEFLPVIGEIVGSATFGVGELVGVGLQIALLKWKRMSELTADRAGLLACQDVAPAISTMMKLAGLPNKFYDAINTEDFIAQAREFEALDAEKLNWLAKWFSSAEQTHPWTVLRANQFLTWVDSGEYQAVVTGSHDGWIPQVTAATCFCTQCGHGLGGVEAFCPGCGLRLTEPPAAPAGAPS